MKSFFLQLWYLVYRMSSWLLGLQHGGAFGNSNNQWLDNGFGFYISGWFLSNLLVLITFGRWLEAYLRCLFFLTVIIQSKAIGVVVDFTDPSNVYDNVKQVCISLLLILLHLQFSNILFLAKAKMTFCLDYDYGHVLTGNCFWDEECCLCSQDWIEHNNCFICNLWKGQHGDKKCLIFHMFISVSPLGFFGFKIQNNFSQGCLVAPTLSIGSVLLQQAAIQASFHYNNVEIVESRPNASVRWKHLYELNYWMTLMLFAFPSKCKQI